MLRLFRVSIEFPELKGLVDLGNRIMNYLEGQQQAEIDGLASRVRTIASRLKTATKEN